MRRQREANVQRGHHGPSQPNAALRSSVDATRGGSAAAVHKRKHIEGMSLAECKAALASLAAAVDAAEKREEKKRAEKATQAEVNALLDDRLQTRQWMVRFNVGGQRFDIPKSNLQSVEGSFFEALVRDDDLPIDKDAEGAIFIDRDPDVFRIIMNYCRGYKGIPNLTLGLASRIYCDAQFYQLDELAEEMHFYMQGTTPSAAHQFMAPGPGINVDRTRLRTVYTVSPVGDRLLLSGRHSVSFLIKRAEYVGLGVISDECASFDLEFHRTRNCCVYYMTGITYTNFPHHQKDENSETFGAGDVVTVTLDMQNRVVEYRLRNMIRCYSCASAVRLRFAVVAKFDSEVSIVDSRTELPTEFMIKRDPPTVGNRESLLE